MKLIVYTDGGAKGNPGPAALGVVLTDGKRVIKRYAEFIGRATNNEAEYQAVIFALQKIKALFGRKKIKNLQIEFRLDSKLVVSQLKGEYKILEQNLIPLFIKIWNLKIDFGKIVFHYIGREKNKEADKLVQDILNQKQQSLFREI